MQQWHEDHRPEHFALVAIAATRDAQTVLLDQVIALWADTTGRVNFQSGGGDAIVRVTRGETLLQPVSTDAVRARYRYHADDAPPRDTFGKREVAILRLIAGGYSNKEIARSLFLAEGTVKNYVSEILDKLGTRDRTRAVLKAITLRII